MATILANKKELQQLDELLVKVLKIYRAKPELLKNTKETKRKKGMEIRLKLVRKAMTNADNQSDNAKPAPADFPKEAKDIIAAFKQLRKTISKNLEDFESDEKDVKMVMEMIERVGALEEGYDKLDETKQQQLVKYRDPIKKKVAPALGKMLKEVEKHLKIVDEAKANLPKDGEGMRVRMAELEEQLASISASLSAN
ncbi:MAG: hypothetical protein GY810_15205 [Aureispira sp.]|nr:hypothetical protein [Aureispira sp.]